MFHWTEIERLFTLTNYLDHLESWGFFLLLLLNAMPILNCKVPFQNLSKSFVLKMPERF